MSDGGGHCARGGTGGHEGALRVGVGTDCLEPRAAPDWSVSRADRRAALDSPSRSPRRVPTAMTHSRQAAPHRIAAAAVPPHRIAPRCPDKVVGSRSTSTAPPAVPSSASTSSAPSYKGGTDSIDIIHRKTKTGMDRQTRESIDNCVN